MKDLKDLAKDVSAINRIEGSMETFMIGYALQYFKWLQHTGSLTNWSAFVHALGKRFGPSDFYDEGELAKLRQNSSVAAYQKRFEALSNRLLRPTSLTEAIGLARTQEAHLAARPRNLNSSRLNIRSRAPPNATVMIHLLQMTMPASNHASYGATWASGYIHPHRYWFYPQFLGSSSSLKKTGLSVDTNAKFDVMVANGNKLPSTGRCTNTTLTIQGTLIHVDFYLLSL
ncbi:hypothetical protein Patl1_05284 [Pistacia atlantica]|uniref:Uncharacterized protein n=1 Tax=Pistacia atlantica TaxID=434234 RepID=A0ACC1BX92_9ROSI|nr:hypothetical protein Patl1_05284 [Pistacia atlantica]